MLHSDNREFGPDADEVSIGDLLDSLLRYRAHPLIFHYDGQTIRSGYHVTEVKAAEFAGLDCGANAEQWTEIFVQLWDVDEGGPKHMPAGRFSAIIAKVVEAIRLDPTAKLTFEVSDGIRPIQLHRATMPRLSEDGVHIDLSPRPASCKPRDRWLEAEKVSACCSTSTTACCGPSEDAPSAHANAACVPIL